MAPDDTIWLTDDGDHTVRQCTLEGKVLLTLGISGKPAPFMSGEPFHRCTHTAMSPQGDIYVSDGYGNSRVHKYAPNGKLLLSWGGPGTDPGEFNIAHNISCDADGWVYVADRENHRVQVFDGNGKYETQWNNPPSVRPVHAARPVPGLLHRRTRRRATGEPRCAEPRPASHHCRQHGEAHFPTRRAWPGPRSNRVLGAAWACGGQPRRPLCRRGVVDQLAANFQRQATAG